MYPGGGLDMGGSGYVPRSNTGLSKHGDPVFPHFCPLNQNRVRTRGGCVQREAAGQLLTIWCIGKQNVQCIYLPVRQTMHGKKGFLLTNELSCVNKGHRGHVCAVQVMGVGVQHKALGTSRPCPTTTLCSRGPFWPSSTE